MADRSIIHGLWIGNTLSALEMLTLRSFIQNGHPFYLWVYENDLEVPEGVQKMDAREIIAEKDVFSYKNASKFGHGKGSLAGFSDIFRYKLLYEQGGIWVDMDITCLQPFDFEPDYLFRHHHKTQVVGNVLKCPKHAPIMQWCYEQSVEKIDADNKNWMLPIEILQAGVKQFGLSEHIRKLSNEDSWKIVGKMLLRDQKINPSWYCIHWMNEEFRRLEIDKNAAIKGSTLDACMEKYAIQHTPLKKKDATAYRNQLSRIKYTWLNVKARYNWWKDLLTDTQK